MADIMTETPAAPIRMAARNGAFHGQTSGLAPGFVQANIAILPAADADAFAAFCQQNRQACPVLAISAPGDPSLPTLGHDIDIRHDLPRYCCYRDGQMTETLQDVGALWRDDLVTFAIGCSFTFEHALLAAGLPLRHVAQKRNVAMYRSNIDTHPVGRFGGKLVVSMRPFRPEQADRAEAISARFVEMHGAPVHRGDPAAIGIHDLAAPDYGDAVDVEAGEVPLFWACGVTSQAALQHAQLPFFLAHAPGCMLVTDLPHSAFDHAA